MKCQKCPKPATFHITDIVEKGNAEVNDRRIKIGSFFFH